MKGTIFLVGEGGKLAPMQESAYANELELQTLLARYCDLLPGDQIDPEQPRRWLFIGKEVGIPGGEDEADWLSLDHLFLDQDAIPTFVECKRSVDTRARREVVAQMLDYAANGSAYWTADRLRQIAAEGSASTGAALSDRIAALIGPDAAMDVEGFWQRVEENLRLGRVRLIFVLDEAPRELRRLVEYLNAQMRDTEVFLLEIKQFKGTDDRHALVPRLIGRTERSDAKKRSNSTRQPIEETFRALEGRSPDELRIAKELEAWLSERGAEIFTTANGFAPRFPVDGADYYPFKITDEGNVVVWFHYLKRKPAFSSDGSRSELLARLNQISGVTIPADRIAGKPSFPLMSLSDSELMSKFRSTIDWIVHSAAGG